MTTQPHILLEKQQVQDKVILCGDPARVDKICQHLEQVKPLAFNREFKSATGLYQGVPITVCSTGIGAPSAIIALEELRQCGAQQFIRVGSAGALQHQVNLGDLLVVEGAVRDEGGSQNYAPLNYPAIADRTLTNAMAHHLAANSHDINYHLGLVRTHDGFYYDNKQQTYDFWHELGVIGSDMETSALMTVGRLRGVQVASILTIVVPYQQDLSQGINDYVNAETRLMQAEAMAIHSALSALASQN